jgi:hypothetical protein
MVIFFTSAISSLIFPPQPTVVEPETFSNPSNSRYAKMFTLTNTAVLFKEKFSSALYRRA